jgi:membrane-associated phospholipid phosphatase
MRVHEPQPHSLSPRGIAIAGWSAFLVAGATFMALAWNVASRAPLVQLDDAVAAAMGPLRTVFMTHAMLVWTHLHSIAAMILWTVVFGAFLARRRQFYWLLTLALAMIGGMLLNVALKFAYERARPTMDEALVTLHTFSFPSGHTAAATTFYGVLAAYLVSRTSNPTARAAAVLGAIAAIALVAFSRVYLGAHYMSDVLAATCSSTAWLALCLSSVHALVRRHMAEGKVR